MNQEPVLSFQASDPNTLLYISLFCVGVAMVAICLKGLWRRP